MTGVWTLGGSVVWVVLGSVAMGAVQWACIVALGRFATPADVGELTLAYAVGAPFFMAANGQMRQLIAADVGSGARFGDYFGLRLACASTAALLTLGAGLVTDLPRSTMLALFLVCGAKWGESLADLCYGLHQASGDSAGMGRGMLVRATLGSMAGVALAARARTAPLAAAGVALSSIAVFVLLERPKAARALKRLGGMASRSSLSGPFIAWRKDVALRLLGAALPLGAASGLAALTWNLPRYFLQGYQGAHEQGVFSALAVFPLAVSTIPGALGQVMTPRLAELRHRGQSGAFRVTAIATAGGGATLALACAVLMLVSGRSILGVTLGPAFDAYSVQLGGLFAASAPQYALFSLNAVLVAAGRHGAQLRALVPAAVAGCVAGLALVPRWGLNGAIAAQGLAGLAQCAMSAWQAADASQESPK